MSGQVEKPVRRQFKNTKSATQRKSLDSVMEQTKAGEVEETTSLPVNKSSSDSKESVREADSSRKITFSDHVHSSGTKCD